MTQNDDLGGMTASKKKNGRNKEKPWDGPIDTYQDRIERQQRIDNIWGPPEPLPRPKTTRIR